MGDDERTPLLGSPPLPRRSARESQAEEQVVGQVWISNMRKKSYTVLVQVGPGRLIRLNRVHLCVALFILAVLSTVTAVLLCAHQVLTEEKEKRFIIILFKFKETSHSSTTASPSTTRQPRFGFSIKVHKWRLLSDQQHWAHTRPTTLSWRHPVRTPFNWNGKLRISRVAPVSRCSLSWCGGVRDLLELRTRNWELLQ